MERETELRSYRHILYAKALCAMITIFWKIFYNQKIQQREYLIGTSVVIDLCMIVYKLINYLWLFVGVVKDVKVKQTNMVDNTADFLSGKKQSMQHLSKGLRKLISEVIYSYINEEKYNDNDILYDLNRPNYVE